MAGRLNGKRTLLTAAGQGIGRASALAMAAEGAEVIATDVNADTLATLADENLAITTRVLDALNDAAISAAAAEIGAVDALFNCTGFVHMGTILECTDEEWDFAFRLNVRAQFKMIQAFLPAMLEAGGGAIINMSSVASSLKGVPARMVYSASKAAVIGMTKSVAADYVTQGIRCNAICPGTVGTPSLEDRMHAQEDYEKALADFIARQPMGRLGLAEEIAALVVYLASDDAAYTTGQALAIDGGWTI